MLEKAVSSRSLAPELDNGMTVDIRGHRVILKARLVLVSADKLGFNALLILCESSLQRIPVVSVTV